MFEIIVLFGLLYMVGVNKAQHFNVKDLWTSDGSAVDCTTSTISRGRFLLFLRVLRFGSFADRAERKAHDNLAAIRDESDEFKSQCKKNYQVGEYSTVHEMLEAFRGRCKFQQHIPSKPAKYGIKVF
ncbi:hypothetical protein ILUMI_26748 [Ignelater luminosus]|uniref:PiggyBac transposable element-derived protein domain-containing protein n=1 Tax=Ignelater luminosus TaxID=2038154 RepID=A0A8K0FVV2_IGNLU|nr:hypothetical protein ILUMI_26748 [Ignelater luminosus]